MFVEAKRYRNVLSEWLLGDCCLSWTLS